LKTFHEAARKGRFFLILRADRLASSQDGRRENAKVGKMVFLTVAIRDV
jgi:hypothetical protein